MARKFLFVVATRKGSDSENELPLVKSLSHMKFEDDIIVDKNIVYDNKRGLSEVYNSILDSDTEHDFIIFLHDDLWINDVFVFDKIVQTSEHADIIGICGGKSWDIYGEGDRPIIWTHASRSRGMSGFMLHSDDGKFTNKNYDITYRGRSIFSSNYGNSPAKVLTIDGCFICFTRKAIDKGVRFDERFKFHFYDMDMCFNAFVKKAEIYTAPIAVTHESLGYSVAQPEYMKSQKEFIKKWF